LPTYEYECKKCGHRFEALQGMSDAPLKTCPKCRGPVEKLISAGGVIVKGGADSRPSCGRDMPCCGSPTVCDTPSCLR